MIRRLASALIALALVAPAAAQAPRPDLTAALHLRPDQRAAYARFQHDTAPDPAREQRRAQESRGVAAMTTPERLDWTTRQVETDLADLRRQGPAVKAFYARLSPDQRRAFDRLTAPKGGPDGR